MEKHITILLEVLDKIVAGEGTWKEKRDKILDACSDDDKTNLYEFVAWFDKE